LSNDVLDVRNGGVEDVSVDLSALGCEKARGGAIAEQKWERGRK
jgi:hypothetical protein